MQACCLSDLPDNAQDMYLTGVWRHLILLYHRRPATLHFILSGLGSTQSRHGLQGMSLNSWTFEGTRSIFVDHLHAHDRHRMVILAPIVSFSILPMHVARLMPPCWWPFIWYDSFSPKVLPYQPLSVNFAQLHPMALDRTMSREKSIHSSTLSK